MLTVYPAIFLKEETGYSISFPDLEGCLTEGDSLEDAMEMAQEALGLYLASLKERNLSIPVASELSSIQCCDNGFATLVSTSVEDYRRSESDITIAV